MSMAVALIAIVWAGLTAYALLGGADFGAGVLHLLLARGPGAERQRRAITTTIGPVWEANHVWLIFSITGLFSAFPRAFDTLGTLAFEPATLALIGVVVRGAALAFAGQADGDARARALFQRLFGVASVAAPFFFGTIAGGLARGGSGGGLGFWLGPFQLVAGALAVAICTTLAASYLAVESHRAGEREMAASFRRLASRGVGAVAALALLGLALMPLEASRLFHGLTHRAVPEVVLALLGLLGAHAALRRSRYRLARAALAFGVTAVMWGWGFAQYPRIAGAHATVANAAASGPELTAVTFALAGGFVLLAPSLWALYVAFRRQPQEVQR
jgi:cytochrome d ubiquinol oxidase subunit II